MVLFIVIGDGGMGMRGTRAHCGGFGLDDMAVLFFLELFMMRKPPSPLLFVFVQGQRSLIFFIPFCSAWYRIDKVY